MAWITAKKKYRYAKLLEKGTLVSVEFVWDIRRKDATVYINVNDEIYEPFYDCFSYVNAARVFLKIVKEIENNINTVVDLNHYLRRY
jgi:hypothetical protein